MRPQVKNVFMSNILERIGYVTKNAVCFRFFFSMGIILTEWLQRILFKKEKKNFSYRYLKFFDKVQGEIVDAWVV